MKKRYTIEVRGLVLGHCDGTQAEAERKAARLASGYETELDVMAHTATRSEWVASVNGRGHVSYPVSV